MADFVFNISLGNVKRLGSLPETNDAFILVPIETIGLEADATLRDYDDLSALIAGTSNEQTTMGRKSVTSVTITVDDTNNRTDFDIADQTYTAASGNAVGAFLWCYDNDTTAGTDANITPVTKHGVTLTPDGNDVTVQINAAGFARAAG